MGANGDAAEGFEEARTCCPPDFGPSDDAWESRMNTWPPGCYLEVDVPSHRAISPPRVAAEIHRLEGFRERITGAKEGEGPDGFRFLTRRGSSCPRQLELTGQGPAPGVAVRGVPHPTGKEDGVSGRPSRCSFMGNTALSGPNATPASIHRAAESRVGDWQTPPRESRGPSGPGPGKEVTASTESPPQFEETRVVAGIGMRSSSVPQGLSPRAPVRCSPEDCRTASRTRNGRWSSMRRSTLPPSVSGSSDQAVAGGNHRGEAAASGKRSSSARSRLDVRGWAEGRLEDLCPDVSPIVTTRPPGFP